MNAALPAFIAALALAPAGYAGATASAQDQALAAINVTINPEERVSVTLGPAAPQPAPRGVPFDLPVRIVNQGFATGRLEARLVGDPRPDAVIVFPSDRLKGVPAETRMLRITLTSQAPVDLTISFRLANEALDLGGRDRIHLLMRSLPGAGARSP
jgi:hypothetical protein